MTGVISVDASDPDIRYPDIRYAGTRCPGTLGAAVRRTVAERPDTIASPPLGSDVPYPGAQYAQQATAAGLADATPSRPEQMKAYEVISEPWSPGVDLVTPTMRARPQVVPQAHADQIEAIYDAGRRIHPEGRR